jgi:hypothetical protein
MMSGKDIVAACLAVSGTACGRVGFGNRSNDAAGSRDSSGSSADGPSSLTPQPFGFVQANASLTNATAIAAVAYSGPVVAPDLLIVAFQCTSTTPMTAIQVTDSLSNTYQIVGPFDGFVREYIAYAITNSGGSDLVTAQMSGTCDANMEIYVHEYGGTWAANPLDTDAGGTGTSTAMDGAATSPIATAQPNELLFGYASFQATGASGTGYTLRSGFDNNVTEDMVAASAGSYQGLATMTNGGGWTIAVAAFHQN